MFGRIKGALEALPQSLADLNAAVSELTAEVWEFARWLRAKREQAEESTKPTAGKPGRGK